MDQAIEKRESSDLTHYDPDKGLKSIAVAEAAEKHWARAKDAEKLYEAVKLKLTEQRKFVIWYDGNVRDAGRPANNSDSTVPILSVAEIFDLDPKDAKSINTFSIRTGRWRKKLKAQEAYEHAVEDAQERCRKLCEIGTVRGTEGTGEFELYTPPQYIEAARLVLGEIDLDPASNDIAQETVRATQYFTEAMNGLRRDWNGRVWLNPPYHRELLPAFVNKMVTEVEAKRVTAAIMLTNNCTDTEWFLTAQSTCTAICFSKGRIKFGRPNGEEVLPTQGQAFFYYGNEVEKFAGVFCNIGFGVRPSWEFEK